jgi:nucleotide-binding universal stress UspA family protein
MPLFKTIVHPTDFDEASMEAFRVSCSLAQVLGARLVVFHVVPPPAVLAEDGRVILDPKVPEPVDLWPEYRRRQADTPKVTVQYAVVVAGMAQAKELLEEKIRESGEGVLLVMGGHGRRGISRFLWGSWAEQAVQECPCPVLVVKSPAPKVPAADPGATTTANPEGPDPEYATHSTLDR